MRPLILINFKLYKEAIGDNALKIARRIAKVNKKKYDIVLAPPILNLREITQKVELPIFAQHCSHAPLGSHTGRISAHELSQMGVKGTILNHSERKIPLKYLKEIVALCKKKKLKTILCASNLSEIKKIAELKPDFLAYEPKELIGTDLSVTKAKPDIIVKAVELVRKISPKTRVLCGAGIHSKEDLGQALVLGTSGVLIAHAVVKSKDPKKVLEEMLL